MKAKSWMSSEKAHIIAMKNDDNSITEMMKVVKIQDINLFYRAKGRIKDIQDKLQSCIFEAQYEYDSFTGKRYNNLKVTRDDNYTIAHVRFY